MVDGRATVDVQRAVLARGGNVRERDVDRVADGRRRIERVRERACIEQIGVRQTLEKGVEDPQVVDSPAEVLTLQDRV